MTADKRSGITPIVRYYVVTLHCGAERIRLGATSAGEAKKAIRSMRRDGWAIDAIRRGTEVISEADLGEEVLREASR